MPQFLHDTQEYRQRQRATSPPTRYLYTSETPYPTHHHSTHINPRVGYSQPQSLPNLIPHLPLILPPPLSPHLRGLNIRRRFIIRLRQHTHNRDENLLHALNRRPPLRSVFVMVGVVTGGMEDGDAHGSVGVDYTHSCQNNVSIAHLSQTITRTV